MGGKERAGAVGEYSQRDDGDSRTGKAAILVGFQWSGPRDNEPESFGSEKDMVLTASGSKTLH